VAQTDPPIFSVAERKTLHKILQSRRDMRHFLPNQKVDKEVLGRIMEAAHSAPSVGLMQPWRFIRITNHMLRENIAQLVDAEIQRTATAMDERKSEFLRLKVEGIHECAELIAVVQAPDDGTIFGRRSLPKEMALCSTACAIQNLWLAARAENLGMGWVSLFDPDALAEQLSCPAGAQPIALLCLGPVKEFYAVPMLTTSRWRKAKPLDSVLFTDRWPEEIE
jgi:5,6-dimethylbenzimidazole synthase